MTFHVQHLSLTLAVISLLGAGCLPEMRSRKIAEPLELRPVQAPVAKTNGFGKLPTSLSSPHTAAITLAVPVPDLPKHVTVIRQRRGTPNDTEFRNISNALGISDGFIGLKGNVRELTLTWNDEKGYHWSYRSSERMLAFSSEHAALEPRTVAALPSTESVIRTATTFLLERGIRPAAYRNPVVDPDWNPSTRIVRFHAFADERDIVQATGAAVDGVELIVDILRNVVVSGHITLTTIEPDRSEYAALTVAQATDLLFKSGTSGGSGNIVITSYSFVFLRVVDPQTGETYLFPSLLATGIRTHEANTIEPARVVVPLVAP